MNQRLKRWESPRKEGRNDKGRGGSARARQLRKQTQMLRNKMKAGSQKQQRQDNSNQTGGGKVNLPPDFFNEAETIKDEATINFA